tara:strand:+ start:1571 stop:1825 length:255 start_codon:yes stop_codon:yes gene_type:complete
MFKRIKQDKKRKTFKKINAKDLRIGVNNLDGNIIMENNYSAILHNLPEKKPKLPKFEQMFGKTALPKPKRKKRKIYRSGEVFLM